MKNDDAHEGNREKGFKAPRDPQSQGPSDESYD